MPFRSLSEPLALSEYNPHARFFTDKTDLHT